MIFELKYSEFCFLAFYELEFLNSAICLNVLISSLTIAYRSTKSLRPPFFLNAYLIAFISLSRSTGKSFAWTESCELRLFFMNCLLPLGDFEDELLIVFNFLSESRARLITFLWFLVAGKPLTMSLIWSRRRMAFLENKFLARTTRSGTLTSSDEVNLFSSYGLASDLSFSMISSVTLFY